MVGFITSKRPPNKTYDPDYEDWNRSAQQLSRSQQRCENKPGVDVVIVAALSWNSYESTLYGAS